MTVQKIFIATTNLGKKNEIRPFLSTLSSCSEIEGIAPPLEEETGVTFVANAVLKACVTATFLRDRGERQFAVIADDSGLEVDLLDGAPGLQSALYAGDHVAPHLHIEKLLRELNPKSMISKERTCRYRCGLAWLEADSHGTFRIWVGDGSCEGLVGFEMKGNSGFGYDPVVLVPGSEKTYGEISLEEKMNRSHRKAAFEDLYQKRKAFPQGMPEHLR
jgi:XTP/dITP diphosphohydrolase